MNAAFVNGVSSHIFDYDDTHQKTIIHPAGPVASAILALTEYHPVNGTDFLNALVLVHQVSDWCSGVAIKMGRRQGATKEHI
jgi:2-methylcitrate dehydratase PrpD